ncbi:MAG: hypothetical protein ACREHD_23610 [Pirellulales bacterium]
MIFADIPNGASVFIDANTFVYHFTPHPIFKAACNDLCDRIEQFGISSIASHDADFDRVPRLTRYSPA